MVFTEYVGGLQGCVGYESVSIHLSIYICMDGWMDVVETDAETCMFVSPKHDRYVLFCTCVVRVEGVCTVFLFFFFFPSKEACGRWVGFCKVGQTTYMSGEGTHGALFHLFFFSFSLGKPCVSFGFLFLPFSDSIFL